MSLHPHFIFNSQPAAIWLQPTLFYRNYSCQLCYDLVFVASSGCISVFILLSQHFWPCGPFLFLHPLSFHRICDILFSWFSLDTSGYLFSPLSGFLFLCPSVMCWYHSGFYAKFSSPFTSEWGQRIIKLKIMGWNATHQKCRFLSNTLLLLNKTFWS